MQAKNALLKFNFKSLSALLAVYIDSLKLLRKLKN